LPPFHRTLRVNREGLRISPHQYQKLSVFSCPFGIGAVLTIGHNHGMRHKQLQKTSRLHSKSDLWHPLVGDVPAWARDASYVRVVDGSAVASSSMPAIDQTVLSSTNLLTIANVAASLQVSTKTVRRLIDRGELDAIRIGRSIRIQPGALALLISRRAR